MRGALATGLALTGIGLLSGSQAQLLASPQAPAKAAVKKYIATRDITIDKVTGQLRRPTTAETQELVDMLHALIKPADATSNQQTLASGATAMSLEGQAAPVMLARPNADGTTEVRCVTSFEEAADFLGLVEDVSQQ